jgi:NDP-sugar pyrophosphorylase family protein
MTGRTVVPHARNKELESSAARLDPAHPIPSGREGRRPDAADPCAVQPQRPTYRFTASEIVGPGSLVAVVLAGGTGSRLRESSDPELRETPKVLVEIDAGGFRQPMLEFVVSGLIDSGINRVVVLTSGALGSDAGIIEAFVQRRYRDCPGVRLVREETRNGTAGAVYAARDLLGGETLLVVPSDTLFPFYRLGSARMRHEQAPQPFTWFATSVAGPAAQNAGALSIDNDDVLISSSENDAMPTTSTNAAARSSTRQLTSAGAVLLDRRQFVQTFERVLEELPAHTGGVDLHRQFLPIVARHRSVRVHDLAAPVPDLGQPDRLYKHGRRAAFSQPA